MKQEGREVTDEQTLILGIFHVFLKNITLKKKERQIKEGEGREGPEKSVSCGWRKVREGGRAGSQPHLPVCRGERTLWGA